MTKKAAVILDDGFEELETIGPIDMLKRGGVDVDVISAADNTAATGRSGITFDHLIPMKDYDFSQIDCLTLPGGPHYTKLEANENLKEIIRQTAADENKVLAAICASPTILGRMGLLQGKDYVCFLSMDEDFGGSCQKQCYAVTDGKLVTGRSAAAAVDFGLAVLEALTGEDKVEEVKKSIYY